jgi:hypothetical protein
MPQLIHGSEPIRYIERIGEWYAALTHGGRPVPFFEHHDCGYWGWEIRSYGSKHPLEPPHEITPAVVLLADDVGIALAVAQDLPGETIVVAGAAVSGYGGVDDILAYVNVNPEWMRHVVRHNDPDFANWMSRARETETELVACFRRHHREPDVG